MFELCNKFGFFVECVFSENNKFILNFVFCGVVDYKKGDL